MILILYIITVLLLMIDWYQTVVIARHPYKWSEINIILGKHPKVPHVNLYFIISIIAFSLTTLTLVNNDLYSIAIVINAIVTTVEFICVVHNYKIGIR